ncbi:MAG: histidine--tRNA ligase [Pseudomonadota bacterium]
MSNDQIVKPRPLSGFPEWLPAEKLVETRLLDIIRRNFELYGFAPIETPSVERKEVLNAKGVEAKEIYALSRLAAEGGDGPTETEMALHFDLTVPLARYVAQHFSKLVFPFRRYQIQKVWRGERPQAGRFREFYQCDIDIIGNGALSILADAEIPSIINAVFTEMGIGRFLIRINNRKVLQGFLQAEGVADRDTVQVLRTLDALEKIGREKVAANLVDQAGLTTASADRLLSRIDGITDLDGLAEEVSIPLVSEGIAELQAVSAGLLAMEVPHKNWAIDLSIARGLDYYTGTVYETRLVDHPSLGSICSGGRYDNLAATFTKQALPGVGISIGLTRLLSRLFDAGLVEAGRSSPADILVTVMDRQLLGQCLMLASRLRGAGIAAEVFTDKKKIGAQLKYADQKGFPLALVLGDEEAKQGRVQIKTLATGDQISCDQDTLIDTVRPLLA